MARYKNITWVLPDTSTWDSVHVALLMDIRDELQQLNTRLACPALLGMPHTLHRIERNTDKKRCSKPSSRTSK